jgi:hypothetical protein
MPLSSIFIGALIAIRLALCFLLFINTEKAAVIEMIRSALDTSDVQELLEAKAAGRGNDQPAEDWTQPASNADGLGGKFDR